MSETLIEQMRRTWAQSDHESGVAMYWSLTPDAYDQLRYESRRGEVWQEGDQPTFMGFPIYRGGYGVPAFMLLAGEPPDDQMESELRRRLDMLHREYRDRAQPIIDELVKLEARKPPKPMIIDAATLELLRDNDRRPKGRDVKQARGVSPPECNRPKGGS